MERVKIFDAAIVIAFLTEMDYQKGIVKLSKRYRIIIPRRVAGEIKKSPGRERLKNLVKRRAIQIVEVDQSKNGQHLSEGRSRS